MDHDGEALRTADGDVESIAIEQERRAARRVGTL
jgi:hypothetical protein